MLPSLPGKKGRSPHQPCQAATLAALPFLPADSFFVNPQACLAFDRDCCLDALAKILPYTLPVTPCTVDLTRCFPVWCEGHIRTCIWYMGGNTPDFSGPYVAGVSFDFDLPATACPWCAPCVGNGGKWEGHGGEEEAFPCVFQLRCGFHTTRTYTASFSDPSRSREMRCYARMPDRGFTVWKTPHTNSAKLYCRSGHRDITTGSAIIPKDDMFDGHNGRVNSTEVVSRLLATLVGEFE